MYTQWTRNEMNAIIYTAINRDILCLVTSKLVMHVFGSQIPKKAVHK